MSRTSQLVRRWALAGCLFGSLFPLAGWLLAGHGLSPASIRAAHSTQPVLWIVDLAPLVLAGTGLLIGFQHARFDQGLRNTDEAVQTRTSELVEANLRLEEALRSRDGFIAAVSHEVRTPLSVIIGFSEELRTDTLSGVEQREILGLIADQSREISHIVDDLLVAARADIGSLTVVPEDTDLSQEVATVVKTCVCADQVRKTIELDLEETRAWADPPRTRQIVRNLLTNAVRYGGERIRIHVRYRGDIASVAVCDNGNGIPDEDRDAIFEAFRQGKSGNRVSQSVGLGLYVSRSLARAMKGDLAYRRENDHSVFELMLPAPADRSGAGLLAAEAAGV